MSWTTTPDTNTPSRPPPAGDPWGSNAIPPRITHAGGWLTSLEKVSPYQGEGTLQILINSTAHTAPKFGGAGTLAHAVMPRAPRALDLAGTGFLTSVQSLVGGGFIANFSGNGVLEYAVNDGLSAIVGPMHPARFSGGGGLDGSTSGGVVYIDGLTAIMLPRYLSAGLFSGVGELTAVMIRLFGTLAQFSGNGTLTMTGFQLYPLLVDLVGSGQLSASVLTLYQRLAALAGSGALTATEYQVFLRDLGLNGAGAIAAALWASFPQPSAQGGVGTLSGPISQRYTLTPPLAGTGTLSASFTPLNTTPFEGEGYLEAEVDIYSMIYERGASFNGSGTLSALVWSSYARAIALAGAGALDGDIYGVIAYGAALSGAGALSSPAWALGAQEPDFTGTGSLGGTTKPVGIIAAPFNGGGTLEPNAINATDGLSAVVYGYVSWAAPLNGSGILAAAAIRRHPISAPLSGSGALSATVTARYAVRSNALVNTDFSTGLTPGWTPFGGTVWWDGTVGHNALGSLKIWGDGAYNNDLVSDRVPVAPGDQVSVSIWMSFWGFTSGAADSVQLAAVTFLDGVTVDYPVLVPMAPSGNGPTWQKVSATYTIPAGVNQFSLRPTVRSTGSGDTWWDDAELIAKGAFLSGGGSLSASVTVWVPSEDRAAPLSGSGALSATVFARYAASTTNAGNGQLSAGITWSLNFTPFTEINAPRVNQPVPAGCTGCYVTLIGAGGGGGGGRRSGIGAGGGSGGGGGGFIPRVFVPVASLGATYSVAVDNDGSPGGASQVTPSANGIAGTAGMATTFVSGVTSMSAGGGGAGPGGTNAQPGGGGGGTVSGATGDAGTAGASGSPSGVLAAPDNGASNSGGAGGGGGGGVNNAGAKSGGSKGGNTNGQIGGAGGNNSGAPNGANGPALVAAVAGAGGGGAGAGTSPEGVGGTGVGYGAGGGGGGGGGGGAGPDGSGPGGAGGPGYSRIEWV
jgi:hypothetical protein